MLAHGRVSRRHQMCLGGLLARAAGARVLVRCRLRRVESLPLWQLCGGVVMALTHRCRVLLACLVVWMLGSLACTRDDPARVRVVLSADTPVDLAAIVVEPPGHVRAARFDPAGALLLETDGTPVTLRIPEYCPLTIEKAPAKLAERVARPLFALTGDTSQVGYDAPFSIDVSAGCEEAERATVVWQQLSLPALAALVPEAEGHRLTARTLPLRAFFSEPLPTGVIAVSPRTQGRYVLSATLRRSGQPDVVRQLTVTSIARATGLSSVAVSQRLMLGGDGWRVMRAPPGAPTQIERQSEVDTFVPAAPGTYVLADETGTPLELRALTHDSTPMDCGRAECHASISSAARSSPMSHTLVQRAKHAGGGVLDASCMLDCHVVGERGLSDGGFLDVARALSFVPTRGLSFVDLPRPLARLGGVRCTSCHGPGAIPPPEGRARILRADVCATCHDAPPRYTHVAEWSRSRMAHADREPRTRRGSCATCHTTSGFLGALGARATAEGAQDQPGVDVGVACAACHAAHGSHEGHALVRTVPYPDSVRADEAEPSGASGVCVRCHAPLREDVLPSASSAALWLGRVRLPSSLGASEHKSAAPHAEVAGGCVGCHGAGASTATRRTDHSFEVDATRCQSCHAGDSAEQRLAADGRTVVQQARQLVSTIVARCGSAASVAADGALHGLTDAGWCADNAELRGALYLTLLVAEDDAAGVHNGPFARSLLLEAERRLEQTR